jgi:cytochrome o ubiquinol oxidase subunit II
MNFRTRAVSQDEFEKWVAGAKQSGPALDGAAYAMLKKQSQNLAPFTYRTIDPNLFQAVVTQEIPPGPGPSTGPAP